MRVDLGLDVSQSRPVVLAQQDARPVVLLQIKADLVGHEDAQTQEQDPDLKLRIPECQVLHPFLIPYSQNPDHPAALLIGHAFKGTDVGDDHGVLDHDEQREGPGQPPHRVTAHVVEQPRAEEVDDAEGVLVFEDGHEHEEEDKQPL